MGLKGYNQYTGCPPPEERFWWYVQPIPDDRGCWEWVGSRMKHGYGQFGAQGLAHRFSYKMHVGPIPKGLTVDHLCRNRSCVNPNHLEVVTLRENVLRGDTFAAWHLSNEVCPKGHDYDAIENGYRRCMICRRETNRARYARNKDKILTRRKTRHHA